MTIGTRSFFIKYTSVSFFLFLMLFQIGKVSADWVLPGITQKAPLPSPQLTVTNQATELRKTIKGIASQLFANLEDQDPQIGMLSDGVAFTVFVDLKKLTRTSSFGRYLAEQLMTEFQQQGYSVLEVRKSKSIMVQAKRGEYGLSRELNEIEAALPARTLLTGTYTLADDHIMVNAKILDNKNSLMLSSATAIFDKNTLTESLLSDSASAYPKTKANIYMKKLEI